MDIRKLNDRVLEDMMEYASEQYCMEMVQDLPPDDELMGGHTFSKEFESKMKNLITYDKLKHSSHRWLKRIGKVASIVLMVGAISFVTVFSVDAFRTQFLQFMIDVQEKYTAFSFAPENGTVVQQVDDWEVQKYYPSFIPKGYEERESDSTAIAKTVIFRNGEADEIMLRIFDAGSSKVMLDTENAQTSDVEINENPGYLVEKNGMVTVIWHNSEMGFMLTGQEDAKTIVQMARSVHRVEK